MNLMANLLVLSPLVRTRKGRARQEDTRQHWRAKEWADCPNGRDSTTSPRMDSITDETVRHCRAERPRSTLLLLLLLMLLLFVLLSRKSRSLRRAFAAAATTARMMNTGGTSATEEGIVSSGSSSSRWKAPGREVGLWRGKS